MAAPSAATILRLASLVYCPRQKSPRLLAPLWRSDDDLALGAAGFDVGQSLVGCFKRKDPIHHRPYESSIDERSDLAQLVAAGSHEEERVADAPAFRFLADPAAQKAHHQPDNPVRLDGFREFRIRRAGDADDHAARPQHLQRPLEHLSALAVED